MLLQNPFDYGEVFTRFALPLDAERVESLYPFAPVFRIDEDLVLKRTARPIERALALAAWETSLLARGIPVVAPVDEIPENPREIDDEIWVVYPYVEGEPYQAASDQLFAAGALLGRLHAVEEPAPGLATHDWRAPRDFDDLERLDLVPLRHDPEEAEAIVDAIAAWIATEPERIEWLSSLELPEADCSYDYKANNLIFSPDGPVLIDPDLARRVPRLLDLALACLLFHNEITGGEGRLLTTDEWLDFLDGYASELELTDLERAAWPEMLRHVFLDHGLWLIFNEYEIDAPLQQAFMDDLLSFVLEPERYPL